MALSKQEMQQLIQELIVFELERAREKFPKPTNSPHEGFAVLKEEIDELDEEIDLLRVMNDVLWKNVKTDNLEKQKETLDEMRIVLYRLLKEAIQVGAMIEKYSNDVL
jgi:hypothetical protein